jgi:membrane-anchored protein YejM (alkaline phosphatase superfamily)
VLVWDLDSSALPENAGAPSLFFLYLWGVFIVFVVALAFGDWPWGRTQGEAPDTLWTSVVAALLWPLFACAVLYLVLWTLLTRSSRRR